MRITEKETMTAEQVIKALQAIDPKTPVVTEGCDCDGMVKSITVMDYGAGQAVAYFHRPTWNDEQEAKETP